MSEILSSEQFPGEVVLNLISGPDQLALDHVEQSRLATVFTGINTLVKQVYESVNESGKDGYHGIEEHIRPLVLTAMATYPAVCRLTSEGQDCLIQAATSFSAKLSLYLPDLTIEEKQSLVKVPEPVRLSREHFYAELPAENNFTPEDLILLYTALSFHDVGRFSGVTPRGDKDRQKLSHEVRSEQVVQQVFSSENSVNPVLKALSEVHPDLFSESNIEMTAEKLRYLIFSTRYQQRPGEQAKMLSQFSLPEQEKLKLLGALTLSIDIGAMQFKEGSFDNFLGLIDEYIHDVDIKDESLTYASARDWIAGWVDDVSYLTNVVVQLYGNNLVMPGLGKNAREVKRIAPVEFQETYIDEETGEPIAQLVSIEMRNQLLAYMRSEMGIDTEERVTWGQLKKSVDGFREFIVSPAYSEWFINKYHPNQPKSVLAQNSDF